MSTNLQDSAATLLFGLRCGGASLVLGNLTSAEILTAISDEASSKAGDIWNLGIAMVQLLGGVHNWDPENVQSLVDAGIPHRDIAEPLLQQYDIHTQQFVLQCLNPSPDERPTATQLLDQLKPIIPPRLTLVPDLICALAAYLPVTKQLEFQSCSSTMVQCVEDNLQWLQLVNTDTIGAEIRPNNISRILNSFPRITELWFKEDPANTVQELDASCIAALQKYAPNLECLHLWGSDRLPVQDVAQLVLNKNLPELSLRIYGSSEELLRLLNEHTGGNIKKLHLLSRHTVKSPSVRYIANWTQLRHLRITHNPEITDAALSVLHPLINLEFLSLRHCTKITAATINFIGAYLHNLRDLNLTRCDAIRENWVPSETLQLLFHRLIHLETFDYRESPYLSVDDVIYVGTLKHPTVLYSKSLRGY